MEQAVKAETTVKNQSLGFTRYEVLSLLWKNAEWLDEKIHKQRIKLTPALRQRVYMVQVQSGVCKNILSGIKDVELAELVKRIDLIEEKLDEKIKTKWRE